MTERPSLLWLPERLDVWEPSGESLEYQPQELILQLKGGAAVLSAELAYSKSAETWLGDLLELVTALAESNLFPFDIEHFSLDGEPLDVSVWAQEAGGHLSWHDFARRDVALIDAADREGDAGDWGSSLGDLPMVGQELGVQPQPFSVSGQPALSDELRAPAGERLHVPPEELAGLARLAESWQIAQAPVTFTASSDEPPVLTYSAIVLTENGPIRAGTALEGEFDTGDLYSLLCRACLYPPDTIPAGRPKTLKVDSQELAAEFTRLLDGSGISVRVSPLSEARRVLEGFAEQLSPETPPPYLSTFDVEQQRRFLVTADEFMAQAPWEVFDANKYIAFRTTGGPWRYACVTGHEERQYGLVIFDSWLDLCRYVSDQTESENLLREDGPQVEDLYPDDDDLDDYPNIGTEALHLEELTRIAPQDAAIYLRERALPFEGDAYPILVRFHSFAYEEIETPLSVYSALLELLAKRSARASTRVTSIKANVSGEFGELQVRYPATGAEDTEEHQTYRFTLKVRPFDGTREVTLEIVTPGCTKWHRIAQLVEHYTRHELGFVSWANVLESGGYLLWVDDHDVREPSPTVGQIAALEEPVHAYVDTWTRLRLEKASEDVDEVMIAVLTR